MLHHILTLFGLLCALYYSVCGRIILLCFMLGELSNIPRLIHKIIMRRSNTNNNHANLLYKIYIAFKASFVWCRMLMTQLTIKVIQPLAPMMITICAYLLIVFTVASVLVEWRLSQNTLWNPNNLNSNVTNYNNKKKNSPPIRNNSSNSGNKSTKNQSKMKRNVHRR